MTKEDKELLLKDLCARLPYGVIANTPKGDGHLCSINQTIFGNEYGVNIKATERDYFNDDECDIKPYLRPMSSITEEESAELSNIISEWFDDELFWLTDEPFIEYALSRINYTISTKLFDWLYKHHFDIHGWIKKGLALEAPKDMYDIK